MSVLLLGLIAGAVGVQYTEIITRKPKGDGYERGFFQDRPGVGVAVVVVCGLVAAWVDIR